MKFRTYIILCTLVLAIGGGPGFVWPTIAQTLQQEPQQPQDPNEDPNQDERTKRYVSGPKTLQPQNITLSYRPEMPVELTSINEEFANDRDTIVITLNNISSKAFRSYGVNVTTYTNPGKHRSLALYSVANHFFRAGYLVPGLPIQQFLADGFLEADEATIEIDFIEFEDGKIWGPNLGGGLDGVRGHRAGMLAGLEKLLALVAQQGPELLLSEQSLDISIPNPATHSLNWQKAFKRGIESAKSRVKEQGNAQDAHRKLLEFYSELKPIVEQDNEQQ
jgi:hypothetical protein